MLQIKNYLSKIYDIKSVLLIGRTKEFQELASWLSNKKGIEKIYYYPQGVGVICSDLPEICTLENLSHDHKQVDAVIFDWGCREAAMGVREISPRFFIGRLNKEEEYFDLWEQYRRVSDFIYLERKKTIPEEKKFESNIQTVYEDNIGSKNRGMRGYKSDEDSCEILEWQRGKEDVELSVILPVYNVEAYLPKCIESLLKWKAPYVEYLFVNDGSKDGSADVIKRYGKKDKRIRFIEKENGGCASARNRGIEKAKGRYLGFVDPDDFIEESMFYKLFRRAMLGNYDLAYCGYKEYDDRSGKARKILNDCLGEPYRSGTYRQDKVQKLAVNTRVAIWRCIYKKDVINHRQIKFHEDLKRFDDLPFRVEYIFAAKSAVCVPEYLYYYRLGRKGQDVACSDKGFFVHFAIFQHLDKYVRKCKDNRMTDLLQVVKIQTHGFALSKIKGNLKRKYRYRAKRDLNKNMGYFRTLCLIMMYTGKGNLGWYTSLEMWPFKRD